MDFRLTSLEILRLLFANLYLLSIINVISEGVVPNLWKHAYIEPVYKSGAKRSVGHYLPISILSASSELFERVKCCEIFFEALNAPALCVKPNSFLALFSAGYTTGLSVDLGEDDTEINPVYEGGSITYANMLTNIAGCQVKKYIKDSLKNRGYNIDQFGLYEHEKILNELWNFIYITPNCAVTKEQYKKEYTLPNGEVIDVSDEVYMAGEMYFQPEAVLGEKSDKLSIQEAIVTSILKIEPDLRSEMLDSIVLHGGRLTMPGFIKRLSLELRPLLHRNVTILEHSEAYSLAWMGGSVFAGMTGAARLWVHKKDFEEHGQRIVKNRF